jgi:hypothetical protein
MTELLQLSNQTTVLWTTASNIQITDTNPHNSDVLDCSSFKERLLFQAVWTQNQSVTITFQGSFDGTSWTNLPNPLALSAGNSTTQTGIAALTDPWPRVRASAVCTVSPSASGNLTINVGVREVVA